MTHGLLIPIPIVVATLAADALSPSTNVPLYWLFAGVVGSFVLAWRAKTAHGKLTSSIKAVERLAGETAREQVVMKRRLDDLARDSEGS